MNVRAEPFKTYNDFDYQGIPYFKIEQDCSELDFIKKWVEFCNLHKYDLKSNKPKMG